MNSPFKYGKIVTGDSFINRSEDIKRIQQSFKDTGKGIKKELIKSMIHITDNHPDYLQQLCHNVWNASVSEVTIQIIDEATDLVVRSNALHYQDICNPCRRNKTNSF